MGNGSKDGPELERAARRIDGEANTALGEERVLERMSHQLNVPAGTLRRRQRTSGLSFGNLFIANALAKGSGKNFDEILSARQSGRGWGTIARENNVRLGEVVSQMKCSSRPLGAYRRNAERSEARDAEARKRAAGVASKPEKA